MTAHEQQDQCVVLVRNLRGGRLLQHGKGLAASSRPLTSALVDQAPRGCLNQPAAWGGRNAVSRPVRCGRDQRLLDGILGSVEVARAAYERTEDPRRQVAEHVLDSGRNV